MLSLGNALLLLLLLQLLYSAVAVGAEADAAATSSLLPFIVRLNTTLNTTSGRAGVIDIEVRPDWAPLGAARFKELVSAGYYDGCRFFRVVPGFVAQIGISGEPAAAAAWRQRPLRDDPVVEGNARGNVVFATSGPDSRTTQWFVNLKDNSASLDRQGFAAFGRVLGASDAAAFGSEPPAAFSLLPLNASNQPLPLNVSGGGDPALRPAAPDAAVGLGAVDALYNGYGGQPDQWKIQSQGNAYLRASFPRLSYVRAATLLRPLPRPPRRCASISARLGGVAITEPLLRFRNASLRFELRLPAAAGTNTTTTDTPPLAPLVVPALHVDDWGGAVGGPTTGAACRAAGGLWVPAEGRVAAGCWKVLALSGLCARVQQQQQQQQGQAAAGGGGGSGGGWSLRMSRSAWGQQPGCDAATHYQAGLYEQLVLRYATDGSLAPGQTLLDAQWASDPGRQAGGQACVQLFDSAYGLAADAEYGRSGGDGGGFEGSADYGGASWETEAVADGGADVPAAAQWTVAFLTGAAGTAVLLVGAVLWRRASTARAARTPGVASSVEMDERRTPGAASAL